MVAQRQRVVNSKIKTKKKNPLLMNIGYLVSLWRTLPGGSGREGLTVENLTCSKLKPEWLLRIPRGKPD